MYHRKEAEFGTQRTVRYAVVAARFPVGPSFSAATTAAYNFGGVARRSAARLRGVVSTNAES
jgi:hypothetical protein